MDSWCDCQVFETPFFPSPTFDPPSAATDRSTGSSQQNTRRYPTQDRNAPKRLTCIRRYWTFLRGKECYDVYVFVVFVMITVVSIMNNDYCI